MFFRFIKNSKEIKSLKFEQIMELIKSDDLCADETHVFNNFYLLYYHHICFI